MRVLVAFALALVLGPAAARDCPPGDVATARAAFTAACDCASAATAPAYRRCARRTARSAILSGTMTRACAHAAMRCVRRSTCGRARSVTCCRTSALGTRCRIATDAASCTARAGGIACGGLFESCCDACASGGCATTSTTTSTTATSTTTTSTTTSTTTTSTSTVTTTTLAVIPCDAGSGYPTCDGACPSGSTCRPVTDVPGTSIFSCSCLPSDATSCGYAPDAYPECGGVCAGNRVCGAFQYSQAPGEIASFCACVDPATTCTGPVGSCASPGYCGAGSACLVAAYPIPHSPSCGCTPR